MQFFMVRRRLSYSIGAVIAIGMFATLTSWQHIVAKGPTKADEQLANEVDVTVPRSLRVAERHTYSIKVTIKSKSEESLPGPIYLVVQGTGIETLATENADDITAANEPFFQFLPATESLRPGKSSISRTIRFKSDGALRSSERKQFKLDYRLTRHVDIAKEKTASRDRQPQRPQGVGSPGSRGSNSGKRTTSRSGNRGSANDPDEDAAGRSGNARREPFELKPDITDEHIDRVVKIQDVWTPKLMKKAGVRGTATGVNAEGNLVIRIYTSRHGIAKNLPKTIEGIPVEPRVVGRIRHLFQPPQDKRGNAGRPRFRIPDDTEVLDQDPPIVEDPQKRFRRPVPIGVSGINASAGCATGTIGCRVIAADGTLYALSNNHVFAEENAGIIGDPILQPGPLDNFTQCRVELTDSIGTLAAFVPVTINDFVTNNLVDAALALVTADTVARSTSPGAYGTPNTHVLPARLGMKVQKMGRTTSHTTGRITAINAAFPIRYGGGTGFFREQIEITNPRFRIDEETDERTRNLEVFGGPGDSGSLIVTTSGKNPVCLLFAGSRFFTFANRIDAVLEELGDEIGQTIAIDGDASNATR